LAHRLNSGLTIEAKSFKLEIFFLDIIYNKLDIFLNNFGKKWYIRKIHLKKKKYLVIYIGKNG
jgi:hypothetical protein